MCYKDFLQRQNNNGRVSPAVSSSSISSLGGSLLAQCSESSTASMPAAISHTDEPSGPTSVVKPAVHSEEHGTSETKGAVKTDDLPVSEDSGSVSVESQDKPKTKAKKSRCLTCRKKVGLTGFDCRCGNMFCAVHRYSDIHNCTYDYKAEAAEKIRKENPVIVGEKIQKL